MLLCGVIKLQLVLRKDRQEATNSNNTKTKKFIFLIPKIRKSKFKLQLRVKMTNVS